MKRITLSLIASLALASACTCPPKNVAEPTPVQDEAALAAAAQAEAEAQAAAQAEAEARAQAEAEAKAQAEAQAQAEREAKEKERAEQLARIAAARESDRVAAEKEDARWTPALHTKARSLASAKYKNAKSALGAIVKSAHRAPGNADRDAYRHPVETLTFFGLAQNMTVVEAGSGRGWYTEILAPFLAAKGKLVVLGYDPNGPEDSMRTVYGQRVQAMLARAPEIFGSTRVEYIDPPAVITMGESGTADMVLAFREMHNWYRSGNLDKYLAAVNDALKPGGVFAVIEHRAAPGADPMASSEKGYLPEAWLIAEIEKAGFKLEAKSEINANPKDTKDYAEGVWTLPPTLTLGDVDRDKYTAIGESDRMTLKFVKLTK